MEACCSCEEALSNSFSKNQWEISNYDRETKERVWIRPFLPVYSTGVYWSGEKICEVIFFVSLYTESLTGWWSSSTVVILMLTVLFFVGGGGGMYKFTIKLLSRCWMILWWLSSLSQEKSGSFEEHSPASDVLLTQSNCYYFGASGTNKFSPCGTGRMAQQMFYYVIFLFLALDFPFQIGSTTQK